MKMREKKKKARINLNEQIGVGPGLVTNIPLEILHVMPLIKASIAIPIIRL